MGKINKEPTVAVIIPTFNRRDMLERALRSVLVEERIPIVVHVHDNASSDGTEKYVMDLSSRDNRVIYKRNPKNIGAIENFIAGLTGVRSEYFVPLADDDYLLPGFLFEAHALLKNDEELGAAAFYAEARDKSGQIVGTWPNSISELIGGKRRAADHLREWMLGSHYAWHSVLWRSSTLAYVGKPYHHTGMASDVDFQAQVFAKFPVFVVKRPGAVFSVHDGQGSHGLSVVDVRSWAKLFARLDRAVAALNLFPAEQYLQLRAVMWQRMQPSWRRYGKTPPSLAEIARFAVDAGFRLGDWELAFHLAAEARKRQAECGRQAADGAGNSALAGSVDLGLRTLELLHGGVQRERALAAQVDALAESMKTLQSAALAVTTDRNRIAAELAALRRERDATSQTPFPPRAASSI